MVCRKTPVPSAALQFRIVRAIHLFEDDSGPTVAEMRLPAEEAVDFDVADIFAPDTMAEKVRQSFIPFGFKSADFQSCHVFAVNRRISCLN